MMTLPVLSNSEVIGTESRPLRASALPMLLECAGRVLLTDEFWGMALGDDWEGSKTAADTGTLVHRAAETFHQTKGDYEAGVAAIAAAADSFPDGDVKRAEKIFKAYAADPKNRDAEVVQLETKIRYEIPPATFDPTGLPIVVNGTLDQVRVDREGVKRVWDIKTGIKFYGTKALHHYAAQQALYTLAAGPDVEPGGLICTDGYFRPGGKVFFRYNIGLEDFQQLLTMVAVKVAFARMKTILRTPGDVCDYCPHKNFDNCSNYVRSHVR